MKYGDRLKKLRNNANLSQKELSDRLHINRSTYARYETSSTQPDFDTLVKLANYFNVTTDYILGNSDDPHKTESEELQEFIEEVKVWYKDEPESKEEKLKMFKKMFEAFKED